LSFINLWASVGRANDNESAFFDDWNDFLSWDEKKYRKRMERVNVNKESICKQKFKQNVVNASDKSTSETKVYVGCQICKPGFKPFTAFNPFKKDQCNPDCIRVENEQKQTHQLECNPNTEISVRRANRNGCQSLYADFTKTQNDQCIQVCSGITMFPPYLTKGNFEKCPTTNFCVEVETCSYDARLDWQTYFLASNEEKAVYCTKVCEDDEIYDETQDNSIE